jgi:hypothetical protein
MMQTLNIKQPEAIVNALSAYMSDQHQPDHDQAWFYRGYL